MTWFQSSRSKYLAVALGSALLGFLVAWPLFAGGQDKKDPPPDQAKNARPADKQPDTNKELLEQIKQLRATIAQLEAAVNKMAPHTGAAATGNQSMTGMKGMSGKPGMSMGMMDMDMMGSMQGGKKGMSGMGMMDMDMDMMEMMGMMGMGSMGGSDPKMKGMSKMKMAAALPGFPGASHIYHIGATGFFLDHPEHITLTTEQKTKLNRIKQKALTEKATADRKVEEGEQHLWELTSADEPDAAQIQSQVQAIEKLRGEQRLAFIRTVGEAAKVLTDEQRKILLGVVQPKADKPAAHTHPKTP